MVYIVTAVVLILYLVLITFLGMSFAPGVGRWVFLISFWLLGLVGAGVFVFFYARNKKRSEQADGENVPLEVDFLVKRARERLLKSRLGSRGKLAKLPVIFVFGDDAAAKTTSILQSGVEPELLAGQVYQDNETAPTPTANLWLARNAVFAEAGLKLSPDDTTLSRFVKRLKPARWAAAFGGKQAARSVVVCVDCEEFLKAGSRDGLATLGRKLRAKLDAAARTLGSNIPVYVLFTKLDRFPSFLDWARNLDDNQAAGLVGITMPFRAAETGGVYAEHETKRVTNAFDTISHALAARRLMLLAREPQEDRTPNIYEFPRDFAKIRGALVKFLVELCRPTRLDQGPMLRGFYFSGVRPVIVNDAGSERRIADAVVDQNDFASPTLVLGADGEDSRPLIQRGQGLTKRVPQWVFLRRLFAEVLLKDPASVGSGVGGSATNFSRRLLWGALSGALLLYLFFATISFFGNRALVPNYVRAGGAPELPSEAGATPNVEQLLQLEELRVSLEQISIYEREGPPLWLRWGLYSGSDYYPSVYRLYFDSYKAMMFGTTQQALLDSLRGLPEAPGPTDEYAPSYNALKAYLITTSEWARSTRDFLSPVLMSWWETGRELNADQLVLAQAQFDFYSDELAYGNPFSEANESAAIERSRAYLAQFNAIESVYQFLLAKAAEGKPTINFNKMYSGSAGYVVNRKDVSGAFSVEGYTAMLDLIAQAETAVGGEEWVLGEQGFETIDQDDLIPQLAAMYHDDFIAKWSDYLSSSTVVSFRTAKAAASRLEQLSSNQSYLLALLCVASENTSVEDEELAAVFQPLHYTTPPGCSSLYVSGNNQSYMSSLVQLQVAMDQVDKTGDDSAISQTRQIATEAGIAVRQTAQGFRVSSKANVSSTTQKLLLDPIRYAEAVLGGVGREKLNSAGSGFCAEFEPLTRAYPFDPNSNVDAPIELIDGIFRPGSGKLWAFYEENLSKVLVPQAGQYVAKTGGEVRITPEFLRFFNRAVNFSTAIYRGSGQAGLAYELRANPIAPNVNVRLVIDGRMLDTSTGEMQKEFVWPGQATRGAELRYRLAGPETELTVSRYDGLWGVFRLFNDADRFDPAGAVEWVPTSGRSNQTFQLPDGRVLTLPFSIDMKGAAPIFQKGYLTGFRCVARVAR